MGARPRFNRRSAGQPQQLLWGKCICMEDIKRKTTFMAQPVQVWNNEDRNTLRIDTATQQQLPEQRENQNMQGAWFTVLACLLLTFMPVRAQWDPSTGRIKPTPGAPSFDPVPWNGAYRLTFRSFLRSEERFKWPSMAFNVSRDCSSEGFDSTPATGLELVSIRTAVGLHQARHHMCAIKNHCHFTCLAR